MTKNILNLNKEINMAVAYFWQMRELQRKKQQQVGKSDQGSRGSATGGAQMDGFINLFTKLITNTGFGEKYIFYKKAVELPGFFRPTKEWDLLVVKNNILIAVIEAKSQIGPSFGNNFNNRTEEAMGSAIDLWTAFREQAYMKSPQPFLGYFFLLEDCAKSNKPVKVNEPHFKVFPEFTNASYQKRYELFCRKLVLERHYTSAAFITSPIKEGVQGKFASPAGDLSIDRFVGQLVSHIRNFV